MSAARPGSRAIVSPLVVLCVAQFVLQLDLSIVNVALKTIQAELDFTPTGLQWVVTSYALTFGALLMLGGRLGDLVGRRRLLVVGLWVFAGASLASGLSVSPTTLIAARFVQGAAAALIAPAVVAILTAVYAEGAQRTRALGIWTTATAAGGTAGIVAGGLLTQYLGWRSIFLVNLPVIAILIPLARRVLPEIVGDKTHKLDTLGSALVTIALAALIFGLSTGEQNGFGSPESVVAFVACALLTAAFLATERTSPEPMIPFSFVVPPLRRASLLVMLVVGGVTTGFGYFMALYLQHVLGLNAAATSLAMVPAPLTLAFTSFFVTRRLIARFGLKPVIVAGLVSLGLGQFWVSHVTVSTNYALGILPGLLLTPFGLGLSFPAISTGITNRVTLAQQGLAGGLVATTQQVGSALGLAILATVAAATSAQHDGSLVDGYQAAYRVATVLVAVSAVLVAMASFGGARQLGDPDASVTPELAA